MTEKSTELRLRKFIGGYGGYSYIRHSFAFRVKSIHPEQGRLADSRNDFRMLIFHIGVLADVIGHVVELDPR